MNSKKESAVLLFFILTLPTEVQEQLRQQIEEMRINILIYLCKLIDEIEQAHHNK